MKALETTTTEVVGVATHLRSLGFNGAAHQELYRFDPPLRDFNDENAYEYVVASASVKMNEVYLFGANEQGEIADMLELPGSLQGTMNYSDAIAAAGYGEVMS